MSSAIQIQEVKPNKIKTQQVLNYCERSFVEQMGNTLTDNFETVLLDIKNKMQTVSSYEDRQVFHTLYQTLKSKQDQFTKDVQSFLQQSFKKISSPQDSEKRQKSNLFIMSKEDEDEHIFKNKLESQIKESIGEDLEHLNLRMNLLVDNNNPFSAETLVKALSNATKNAFDDQKQQAEALALISHSLKQQIKLTYQGINNYLVANDIIPDIETYKTSNGIIKRESISANDNKNNSELPSQESLLKEINSLKQQVGNGLPNIQEQINQSMDSFGLPNLPKLPGLPGLPSLSNSNLSEVAKNNSTASNLNPNLKEKSGLTQQQTTMVELTEPMLANFYSLIENSNLINTSQIQVPAHLKVSQIDKNVESIESQKSIVLTNEQLIKSINSLQKQFLELSLEHSVLLNKQASSVSSSDIFNNSNLEHKNVISELVDINKSQDINNSNIKEATRDKFIIELLSVLFDKIFENNELADHTKYMIGKLQIPMLKVSLSDNSFFTNENNPVRLFLDCLATSKALYNIDLQNKFENIINDILKNTTVTYETFDDALKKIQNLLKEQENKETIFLKSVSNNLENEEKSQLFIDPLNTHISKTVNRATYLPVKKFIETVWAKAFCKKWSHLSIDKDFISSLSLEAKVGLNQSLLLFDMMIWSTNIKENSKESLEKIKTFMPKISNTLHSVCVDLSIPQPDYDNLSFLLADRHLAFTQFSNQKDLDIALTKNKSNEEKITTTFDNSLNEIKQINITTTEIKTAKVDFDTLFIQGEWFEFGSEKTKIRLLWISPKNSLYLFSNPDNKKVYKFDKSRVWSYYKNKNIVPLKKSTTFSTTKILLDSIKKIKNIL